MGFVLPMKFQVRQVPFVMMARSGLDMWEKMPLPKQDYGRPLEAVRPTFVSLGDIEELVSSYKLYIERGRETWLSPRNSVWRGGPGFMSPSWVPRYSKVGKPYDYRFSTGLYCGIELLLLYDDVCDWSHRRIPSTSVRSLHELVMELGGTTTKPPYRERHFF